MNTEKDELEQLISDEIDDIKTVKETVKKAPVNENNDKKIQEVISNFQKLKAKSKKAFLIAAGVIAAIAVVVEIVYFVAIYDSTFPFLAAGLVPFVALVLILMAYTFYHSRINKYFKNNIVSEAAKICFGPKTIYKPFGGFSKEELQSINLFPVKTLTQEDHFLASYKGVKFEAADVRSYEVHSDSDGGSHTHVYFDGMVLKYSFNKPFDGYIRLVEKEGALNFGVRKMNKVKVESIEFNKAFDLYSTNEQAAFYVLTPQMIMAFLEIKSKYVGAINISIDNNNIIFAINGATNRLEANIVKGNDTGLIDLLIKQMDPMKGLIDILDLDNDLFLKSRRAINKKQSV